MLLRKLKYKNDAEFQDSFKKGSKILCKKTEKKKKQQTKKSDRW